MTEKDTGLELVIRRVFDAPRDIVFKAWTEPEQLKHWWGPEGFTLPFLEMDSTVGGKWRACMRGPDGMNYWQHGVTLEMVPPERLAYTLVWENDPGHEMLVTIAFAERGEQTHMLFRQRPFKSVETRDGHVGGWSSSFHRLDSLLALSSLPNDIASLARVVQGIEIHQFMAHRYGVTVPESRVGEAHLRRLRPMLDRILELDPSPLTTTRPPGKRLVGICYHFAKLFVSMMRAKGIAARSRYGFGSFFNAPYFEEHIVAEYWNAADSRWVMVDAQLDEIWRQALHLDFDPLDVPHDRFILAGDAWAQCRSGAADPARFGIFTGNLRGLWFIAAEVIRDANALNGLDLLPWDVWGPMPKPDETLPAEQLAFFDRLAAATRDGHVTLDDQLRVPPTVFNAVRNRPEEI
jgi:uncharacterized protein YndB with AHSA1/START domain